MGCANVILIGFMGSGKSTVGRLVAKTTGLAFVDTDDELERRTGRPVRAIFAEQGEEEFRRQEAAVVAELAEGHGQVIATGGGVVLREENLAVLRRAGLVVGLTAATDALWERVAAFKHRPLLAGDAPQERFAELSALRAPLYAQADVVVDTTGREPGAVAQTVIGHWRLAAAPGRLGVPLATGAYTVYVGPGLLAATGAGALVAAGGPRVAVVTDRVVDRLYGETVRRALEAAGREVVTLLLPEGEAAKRLPVIEDLYHRALAAGLERDDLVVALGGGTVGDAAGFFAATYLRGLPFLQVPTTLLAQVDASVGGKVGVNLDEGKNLVGAFHQPAAVLADVDVLRTLPRREVLAGLAEVVKCGVLADAGLFTELERWPAPDRPEGETETGTGDWPPPAQLIAAIEAAIAVKAAVVARDERETGPRVTLNLGHTAAHAVEKVTGFGLVRHGEAVGYGLAVATRVAERLGHLAATEGERVFALLGRLGLPRTRAELPALADVEDLLRALARDKKARHGRVRWVLPRRIGEVLVTGEVPETVVRECL